MNRYVGKIAFTLAVAATAVGAAALYVAVRKKIEQEGLVGNIRIPNPMAAVENETEFEKIDLKLKTPEKAEDLKYFIISNQIAQINCTIDGEEYCFRAARGIDMEELSGIYGQWEPSGREGKAGYYVVKSEPECYVAFWMQEDVLYVVSTEGSEEKLAEVTEAYIG